MHRRGVSKPVRLALEHSLIHDDLTVLDYGCGRGVDVRALCEAGIRCTGWDPVHLPAGALTEADVVNLGYVINVIEDGRERQETLRQAWSLARRVLVVSGRLEHERRSLRSATTYEDGLVTSRGTFQKFYEQSELRNWIQVSLQEPAIPAAPGVFFVFRAAEQREEYVARLFRRRTAAPKLHRSETFYRENEAAFAPLLAFMLERGRPPYEGELPGIDELLVRAGTIKRAVNVVSRVFGHDHWRAAADERRADLSVYLALAKFGGRPRSGDLATLLRNDARAFFGSYRAACSAADDLLFKTGNRSFLEESMHGATVGKLTPAALYIHREYLDTLPPALRVYEGCARTLAGEVSEGNVVKLARGNFQISYLSYPDFDKQPHPPLNHSVVVNLQELKVRYRFYNDPLGNPPILHRKEEFIASTDIRWTRFRRLTEQEERFQLLDESETIGTRDGWEVALSARGVRLAGHRVVRSRNG